MSKKEFNKTGLPKTPRDCISEAKRYYENAKHIRKSILVKDNTYTDVKTLQKACGIGYLSALFAIDGFLMTKGIKRSELPISIEGYWDMLEKHAQKNGTLTRELTVAYQNLHILGYYRGGIDVEMIKSGFKNAKLLIDYFAQFAK